MNYNIKGDSVEVLKWFLMIHSSMQTHNELKLTDREATLLANILFEEEPFSTKTRKFLYRKLNLQPANYSSILRNLTDKFYIIKTQTGNEFPPFLEYVRNQVINNDSLKINVNFEIK